MMYPSTFRRKVLAVLVGLMLVSTGSARSSSDQKALLKNIQTLTLHKDRMTTYRRVSPVPQLKCIGGNGCRHHQVEVMRCENAGADYDEGSIQWTCRADVPQYFKLGSTEVKCEGYSSPKDPFILKGSCGVEYRLLLTEKGEQQYGHSFSTSTHQSSTLFNIFFWILFLGVAFWIIRSAITSMRGGNNNNNNQGPRRPPFDGWGGGGGGGGGGGWFGGNGPPNDPPPPYAQFPSRKRSSQQQPRAANEGWRPGFWTGVLGGGAGGYLFGRRDNERDRRRGGRFYNDHHHDNGFDDNFFRRSPASNPNNNAGEGSSGSGTSYTSTGFGGTTNR